MRVGVFGGTFDPPHNGHLAICLYARELLGLDRLIVSVSKNPFKAAADASDAERLEMAERLVAEINATGLTASACRWEIDQEGPSYTIDLLRHLKAEQPQAELILVIGEDSWRSMHRWKDPEGIAALSSIAVFLRHSRQQDAHTAAPQPDRLRIIPFDMPVSATGVRRLIGSGEDPSRLIPPSIAAYIEARALYR